MGMIKGTNSDVWLTASPSVALGADESCTDAGDHINYTANTHSAWDKRYPVVVQCSPNGSSSWATVTDYTFQYAIGRIVFDTARSVGVNNYVRIHNQANSSYYFNLTQLDECHAWSLSIKANNIDTTPFQSTSGYTRKTFTTSEASGKIESYRTDDRVFAELGNLVVVKLYADYTGSPKLAWACLAWITGVDPKSDATGVNEQNYAFESEGGVYAVQV